MIPVGIFKRSSSNLDQAPEQMQARLAWMWLVAGGPKHPKCDSQLVSGSADRLGSVDRRIEQLRDMQWVLREDEARYRIAQQLQQGGEEGAC